MEDSNNKRSGSGGGGGRGNNGKKKDSSDDEFTALTNQFYLQGLEKGKWKTFEEFYERVVEPARRPSEIAATAPSQVGLGNDGAGVRTGGSDATLRADVPQGSVSGAAGVQAIQAENGPNLSDPSVSSLTYDSGSSGQVREATTRPGSLVQTATPFSHEATHERNPRQPTQAESVASGHCNGDDEASKHAGKSAGSKKSNDKEE